MQTLIIDLEIALLVAGLLAVIGTGLLIAYQAWDNRLNRVALERLKMFDERRQWGKWPDTKRLGNLHKNKSIFTTS